MKCEQMYKQMREYLIPCFRVVVVFIGVVVFIENDSLRSRLPLHYRPFDTSIFGLRGNYSESRAILNLQTVWVKE